MDFHITIKGPQVQKHYWAEVKNSGELPFAFEDAMQHYRSVVAHGDPKGIEAGMCVGNAATRHAEALRV
jgi:hypothetical protein